MPSTVIKSFYYDAEDHRLRVIYVSGAIYDYLEVPQKVYEIMKASGSKGVFLNREIKGRYAFKKVE
jgi:hypothetical protein